MVAVRTLAKIGDGDMPLALWWLFAFVCCLAWDWVFFSILRGR